MDWKVLSFILLPSNLIPKLLTFCIQRQFALEHVLLSILFFFFLDLPLREGNFLPHESGSLLRAKFMLFKWLHIDSNPNFKEFAHWSCMIA